MFCPFNFNQSSKIEKEIVHNHKYFDFLDLIIFLKKNFTKKNFDVRSGSCDSNKFLKTKSQPIVRNKPSVERVMSSGRGSDSRTRTPVVNSSVEKVQNN